MAVRNSSADKDEMCSKQNDTHRLRKNLDFDRDAEVNRLTVVLDTPQKTINNRTSVKFYLCFVWRRLSKFVFDLKLFVN